MQTILVPTDFSDEPKKALNIACQIAQKTGAHVQLYHLIEESHPIGFQTTGGPSRTATDPHYMAEMIAKAKRKLHAIIEDYKSFGVEIHPKIGVMDAFENIAEEIVDKGVDLIVIGTKGAVGLEKIFGNSNTAHVVRLANCPVLAVHDYSDQLEIKNIVFATDLDEKDFLIIQKLRTYQKIFNAHLHLVRINLPGKFENTAFVKMKMQELAKSQMLFNYSLHTYDASTIEEGVISFAEEVHADLISLATHGRKGLAHLLKGSVAEGIANQSHKMVLTFNLSKLLS
jgi:nucleotide-binding universal stress UspA family protein